MALDFYSDGRPMHTCLICNKHLDYEVEHSFDSCLEHRVDVYNKKKIERELKYKKQLDMCNEITTSSCIVCPHCCKEQKNYWECITIRDAYTDIVTCDRCDKEFNVTVSVVYEFTSEIIKDEDN